MLKLKLQYFGHLMQRVNSLEDSAAGKDWGQEVKGATKDEIAGWHHWPNGQDLSQLWEMAKNREVWHAAVHGISKSQTQLATEQ